ncbi:MAG: DUF6350 family protein [Actinomycetota bacterium]
MGSGVFLAVALIGEAMAFVVYLALRVSAGTGHLGLVDTLRLGAMYFFAFHHVTITTSVTASIAVVRDSGPSFGYQVALLSVTGLAVWLLFRSGRRLASDADGGTWRRILGASSVAIPYALLPFLLSYVTSLGRRGPVRLDADHLGALLVPLALGAVAGGAGGLFSGDRERAAPGSGRERVLAALAGGWRAFLAALVLSFVGLLVLAAAKPEATRRYVTAVTSGAGGAAGFAHHVLALPDQSLWVLVPAMGGCDALTGRFGRSDVDIDLLCYGHFPGPRASLRVGAQDVRLGQHHGRIRPPEAVGFETAPPPYFLFLLVPALATVSGGLAAARRTRSTRRSSALAAGAGSGVVFGVLVGAGAWLAGIGFSASARVVEVGQLGHGSVGPRPVTGGLVALLWGVAGGAVGSLLARSPESDAAPD